MLGLTNVRTIRFRCVCICLLISYAKILRSVAVTHRFTRNVPRKFFFSSSSPYQRNRNGAEREKNQCEPILLNECNFLIGCDVKICIELHLHFVNRSISKQRNHFLRIYTIALEYIAFINISFVCVFFCLVLRLGCLNDIHWKRNADCLCLTVDTVCSGWEW